MPGIAVTAAPCAALQPRAVPHSLLGRRLRPDFLAGVDLHGAHAARRLRRSVDAEVRLLVVHGRAPLAAEAAAVARPVLPHQRALLVGIDRVRHARFLLDDEQVLPVRRFTSIGDIEKS